MANLRLRNLVSVLSVMIAMTAFATAQGPRNGTTAGSYLLVFLKAGNTSPVVAPRPTQRAWMPFSGTRPVWPEQTSMSAPFFPGVPTLPISASIIWASG